MHIDVSDERQMMCKGYRKRRIGIGNTKEIEDRKLGIMVIYNRKSEITGMNREICDK